MSKTVDLSGQTIAVGVGGGIAAYRSLELIRLIKKAGAHACALPTRNALQFVGELSFEALSGQPCYTNPLSVRAGQISHIEVAETSSAFVVAPATADLLAKMAHGMADEIVLQALLSFRGPCVVAPAMEANMWEHDATRRNVALLRERGYSIVGPHVGELASGRVGVGRMAEPAEIFENLLFMLAPKDFLGKRVLVTAGPTIEDLDPVRFISNRSSGKMGAALARALAQRGADVELVYGPMSSEISSLQNIKKHSVRSASQMFECVMSRVPNCDVAILCAAVADFTPAVNQEQKIKKSHDTITSFSFSKTADILRAVGALPNRPFLVGFAAETQNLKEEALRKCVEKNCDLLCGNIVGGEDSVLESESAQMLIVDKQARSKVLERAPKSEIAHAILDVIQARMQSLTSDGPL